jgi:DNA-binding SARP family transcriptional activator
VPERVAIRLLDGFSLVVRDRPISLAAGSQQVIAFLALTGRRVARSVVAGSIWPDRTEDRARANVRTAVYRLPNRGDKIVIADRNMLALDPAVDCDATRFHQLARDVIGFDPVAIGADEIALLRADLLPGWDAEWLEPFRERIRQLRLHALERLCARLVSDGRHGEAVDAGLAAVLADPTRESAYRVLIAAHLNQGNAGEALRQYHRYCTVAREDLGVAPSPRLEALVAGLGR